MDAISQRASSQNSQRSNSNQVDGHGFEPAPAAPAADAVDVPYDQRLTQLLKAEGIKGQAVGGALLGALSVSTGFDYVCTQQASFPSDKALACVLSAPSVKMGGRLLRAIPAKLTGPLAYVAPSTRYATQFPDKLADFTSALMAWGTESIPWENIKGLMSREPSADYPASCDPTEGSSTCPDPLSWDRASRITPYYQGILCVSVGVAVGAYVGKTLWRDWVRHVAALPIINASELPLDAFASVVPGIETLKKTGIPPYNLVVKIAKAEVARREEILAAPVPNEQTPLVPRSA